MNLITTCRECHVQYHIVTENGKVLVKTRHYVVQPTRNCFHCVNCHTVVRIPAFTTVHR